MPFYVDFVVKFKDGRIGLFDPHGTQFSDFGPKSDGLRKYIKEENKKGKKLFGGLVANTGITTNNGRWVYFPDSGDKFKKGEFENWTDLELQKIQVKNNHPKAVIFERGMPFQLYW